jgi:hypothetical protein
LKGENNFDQNSRFLNEDSIYFNQNREEEEKISIFSSFE